MAKPDSLQGSMSTLVSRMEGQGSSCPQVLFLLRVQDEPSGGPTSMTDFAYLESFGK